MGLRSHVSTIKALHMQAHADAMGSWGAGGGPEDRRPWEGDGRVDLRSVSNASWRLPYHVAVSGGFPEAARALNPSLPINAALESCRELDDGEL